MGRRPELREGREGARHLQGYPRILVGNLGLETALSTKESYRPFRHQLQPALLGDYAASKRRTTASH